MIRKLLATTAMAGLLASGAYAQDATAPAPAPAAPAESGTTTAPAVTPADGFLASNLIGENVYNGTGDNAETIGDVNDVVIGSDGTVDALIVGVGGFLGIGEKHVAIEFSEAKWAEGDGDRWLVVEATKESLEALPAFDRAPYDVAPAATAAVDPQAPAAGTTAEAPAATDTQTTAEAPAAPAPDSTAQAPAATDTQTTAEAPAAPAPDATAEAPAATGTETTAEAPAAPAPDATAEAPAAAPAPDATAQAPAATDTETTAAIDKSKLTELPADKIRSEELVGTTVYGANDETIGEIGDVILSTDNKVDSVIIDVGGFLGMGEKEVAVGMDNLAFMTDADGNTYLYTNFTKEQLDAQAAYDESTWAEKRDEQRMIMTQ